MTRLCFGRMILTSLACVFLPGPAVAAPADYDTHSVYVAMSDGVKLAVDVHLPADRAPEAKLPALLELTRYWRATEDPRTGKVIGSLRAVDHAFLKNGYALVKVDVRGSGASFGTRLVEYGPQEVRDGGDIVSWVVSRPWCNGRVGAYGTSYTGTTAELLAAVQHPALKAAIPGWSDFDVYRSPARPYGLIAGGFIKQWSQAVAAMDRNDAAVMGGLVKRVDADVDGAMRAAAVKEHRGNPDVYRALSAAEFRDQPVAGGASMAECSSLHWKKAIEAAGTPMLVFASWLDAGTADGALQRFRTYRNPQRLVILASSHGGRHHASPYAVSDRPLAPIPSFQEQIDLRVRFLNHYLKGEDQDVDRWPLVRYFNMGEEAFRESDAWPPANAARRRFYFHPANRLTAEPPEDETGHDAYAVNYAASTGVRNRWMTQMGTPVFNLDNRAGMDAKMLTYTSEPLTRDLQITGAPVARLQFTADRADSAVLVYLQEVDETGRSRYLTEGGLRAIHRKLAEEPGLDPSTPHRSFNRADAQPLVPGQTVELAFSLWSTSALIRKGRRLRVAIAGADRDTFDRVPASGDANWQIHRDKRRPSYIDLPIIEPR